MTIYYKLGSANAGTGTDAAIREFGKSKNMFSLSYPNIMIVFTETEYSKLEKFHYTYFCDMI